MVRPNWNLPGGRGMYAGREALTLLNEQLAQRSSRVSAATKLFYGTSGDGYLNGALTAITPTANSMFFYPLEKLQSRIELKRFLAYVVTASGTETRCGLYLQNGTTLNLVAGSEVTINTTATGLKDIVLNNECILIPDKQYYLGFVGNGATFGGYRAASVTTSGAAAVVENIKTGTTNASSWALSLGFTPTEGNFLVAFIASRGNQPTGISQSNVTWSTAVSDNSGNTYFRMYYSYQVAASAGSTVTFTFASNYDLAAIVTEFSGVDTTADPIDQTINENLGATYRLIATPATATVSPSVVIGALSSSGGANYLTNYVGKPLASAYSALQACSACFENFEYDALVANGWDSYNPGAVTTSMVSLAANFQLTAAAAGGTAATGGVPIFKKAVTVSELLPGKIKIADFSKTYQSTSVGVVELNYVTGEGNKVI